MALCATEETKGFYYGYFWAWYMSAQIIGNLSGAFVIKQTMGSEFFIIASSFEILTCCGFFFIQIPNKHQKPESNSNKVNNSDFPT